MRHQNKTIKLGRTAAHRKAMLANQVCSLIEHGRIKTTLAKAKAVRPLAEKMVTLGKKGSIHARRTAFAVLRQKNAVKNLFDNIAPRSSSRNGGYTRIVKLGQRKSDSAAVAFLEWVDAAPAIEETPADETTPKSKKEATPKTESKAAPAKEETKEQVAPAAEEEAKPAPSEEVKPQPKKRKWFGKKGE